jgi:anti-sigma B factor antagonist
MEVITTEEPGLIIAMVRGRFDAHTVGAYLADVVDRIDPHRASVIVDLTAVEFMDSSALAALVTTLKRTMEHGGEIVLAGVADAARIILELTRLDQVFPQATTVETARMRLASPVG